MKRAFILLCLILLVACSGEPKGELVVVRSTEPAIVREPETTFIPPRPRTPLPPTEPVLQVDFLKAGHGDATLIRTPDGKKILINCGAAGATDDIIKFFEHENVSSVDILMATSRNSASTGGCGTIKNEIRVGRSLENALADVTSNRANAGELEKRGFKLEGGKIWLRLNSNVTIQLMLPYDAEQAKRAEDHTLVPKITYGMHDILLLNNCGVGCQRELLAENLTADVAQLAQHAREEANEEKLLDRIQPSIAIASVGTNNAQRLPRQEMIMRLNQRRIKLYRTDVQYTVSLVSNGKTLSVDAEVPYRLERVG